MLNYDSEVQHHHSRLLRAVKVRRKDRVLDIGCGMGQTTRDVARVATGGCVLGVDLAIAALRRARELSSGSAPNARYVRADAAHLPFPAATFDVAISRFGTMFFNNPVAAFTSIHH